MRLPNAIAVKRLTLRTSQFYWKTYWNWYWNLRHNRFYANIAKYPMRLTIVVCGFRYTTGDGIAQWTINSKINKKRTATFLLFGLFSGAYAFYMYSRFYPMLIRRFNVSPVFCIAFENTIPCPIIYYGAFYVTQGFVNSGTVDLSHAFQTANANRLGDIKSLWMFWGPMHFISFNYVHPSMRGAFAGLVGTGWVLILSLLRGDPHAEHASEDSSLSNEHMTVLPALDKASVAEMATLLKDELDGTRPVQVAT